MPDRSITVGIICGGPSPEASVSRLSAGRISSPLAKNYKKVVTLELDEMLPANLTFHQVDVVFPVAHGPMGEDGCLQGLLEIMGIPYVGSTVLGSACALDKVTTKRILQAAGIPMAKDCVMSHRDPLNRSVSQCIDTLGEKVIIKPVAQGSGIGIQFAQGEEELTECLRSGFEKDERLLVETFIHGKEVTAGVLELDTTQVLSTTEIITPDNAWYDYTHRYTPGLSEHIIPARITDYQRRRVQEIALQAHQLVRCRDISRSDFIVPASGEPIFSEINNLPGMTPTSLFPDGARHAGIEFEELICRLIDNAMLRKEKTLNKNDYWPTPELNVPLQ
ncbi:D-alanine--D-alanine ligase [Endozoicomonas sp. SCSIO W0465]|uniref:D-alanine--D-alanine ligase family protein n=1 Tax=Endozoicomonas sp. SCSIO W0465 TaxID=2918516 RepID=UPI002075D930|nr:D-alanine--D-alanine ligase [Endozoicomonas sp. SCSIO W0465]USE35140.1 D-alanine--D-alanine ligase [Endozoicomonas sp. SCSIO W0465]